MQIIRCVFEKHYSNDRYLSILKFCHVGVFTDEVINPLLRSFQSGTSDDEDEQDNIWEEGGEVYNLKKINY